MSTAVISSPTNFPVSDCAFVPIHHGPTTRSGRSRPARMGGLALDAANSASRRKSKALCWPESVHSQRTTFNASSRPMQFAPTGSDRYRQGYEIAEDRSLAYEIVARGSGGALPPFPTSPKSAIPHPVLRMSQFLSSLRVQFLRSYRRTLKDHEPWNDAKAAELAEIRKAAHVWRQLS
jgi:hypothetical protein